eukprot:4988042-Amphidinium_carterae.1
MDHPSTGTPLPQFILTPGGLVPASVTQNPQVDSTGYEPNLADTQPPGSTLNLMPPPPLSGRSDRRG